jgi:UDP-N-acetylmuramyl-tripeptide synthetase
MDSYLRAKKHLFDGLDADAVAAVNGDDPACEQLIADCRARVTRYGIQGGRGDRAGSNGSGSRPSSLGVTARILEQSASGTRFEIKLRPGPSPRQMGIAGPVQNQIFTPLIGNHNVQNCLAAVSAGLGLGVPMEAIVRGLAAVQVVPGRLQRVPVPLGKNGSGAFSVFVDYAHTDDALNNVLSTLKPFAEQRRLIVLFGCGGDRDPTKRPRMARAVARWADCILLTSDNPRTEDPLKIIDDAKSGFAAQDLPRVQIEPDRRCAIQMAMRMAQPGDVVLLAGKGHETYQQIGMQKFPFDDAAIAAEMLAEELPVENGE